MGLSPPYMGPRYRNREQALDLGAVADLPQPVLPPTVASAVRRDAAAVAFARADLGQ